MPLSDSLRLAEQYHCEGHCEGHCSATMHKEEIRHHGRRTYRLAQILWLSKIKQETRIKDRRVDGVAW